MLLGSPPDMVHRAPAHGAHIRMQNSAIYSPVRSMYYTIPFGKLQVGVGGLRKKVLLSRVWVINYSYILFYNSYFIIRYPRILSVSMLSTSLPR